jgi:hypothetical protein
VYPEHHFRGRTMVQLHRAIRLVRAGDLRGGLSYARQLVEDLPGAHRTQSVQHVARQVVHALPAAERNRSDATELRELVGPPAVPAR